MWHPQNHRSNQIERVAAFEGKVLVARQTWVVGRMALKRILEGLYFCL